MIPNNINYKVLAISINSPTDRGCLCFVFIILALAINSDGLNFKAVCKVKKIDLRTASLGSSKCVNKLSII